MKKLLVILVLLNIVGQAHAAQGDQWNVRFSPVGLLIGLIGVDVDYKLTDKVVVGPSLLSWNLTISDASISASGFGVQGAYYPDTVFVDGFYLGGLLGTSSFSGSITEAGKKSTASVSGTSLGVKGGYHWFWESFNLNLGLVFSSSHSNSMTLKDSSGAVTKEINIPSSSSGLDFNFGFTF